jgi:hypothetical protein
MYFLIPNHMYNIDFVLSRSRDMCHFTLRYILNKSEIQYVFCSVHFVTQIFSFKNIYTVVQYRFYGMVKRHVNMIKYILRDFNYVRVFTV